MAQAGLRVVGTAGHVDHGKSTLINALTGIDPDRLREERERGMTIDLGFAWLKLPGGATIGIVDVPGHRDFIRNMLAGIGSIDAVLLVIAADEGVMPQTREHLAILGLLGIERGVIALTKRDLVDDEWAELARSDVREALKQTPLADAPLVEVSSTTKRGLDELRETLERVLGETPPRRDAGRPRLPIDRAFTMAGFGTVVTGTLLDGSFKLGEEVEAVPGGIRGRVRGLQTHRQQLQEALPGSRVAMNLSGVDKEALARGMVIVRPGTLDPTSVIATHLTVLPDASVALEHDEAVKVHVGTVEEMARVSVLEGDSIEPGGQAWVQLRLASPIAAAVGDRLVLRRPSPSETIGGGVIADVAPARLRRRAEAVDALERRVAPSPASRLLVSLDAPRTAEEAAKLSGLDSVERDAAVAELVERGDAVRLGDALLSRIAYEASATRVERMAAQAHRRTPLRAGVPREEVRSAVGLSGKVYASFVERIVSDGRVVERGNSIALPDHEPKLSTEQQQAWLRAKAVMAKVPMSPPTPKELESLYGIDRELMVALADRGELVRIGTEAAFLPEPVGTFARTVIAELEAAKSITIARARDLTGSSRKFVLPLMTFLDDQGVTRRVGDERHLQMDADAARARVEATLRRA